MKKVETSRPPPAAPPRPPAGTCSERTLRTLLRLSLCSPPPSLKVSVCVACCRLLLQHRSDAVFSEPVDRLSELLLDSNSQKQSVTNGNQELSSEWPALLCHLYRCFGSSSLDRHSC